MIIGRKKKQKIICKKICYSKSEAQAELNLVKKLHHKWRTEIRIYPCPQCKMQWHLTSKLQDIGTINIEVVHQELWQQILKNQEECQV